MTAPWPSAGAPARAAALAVTLAAGSASWTAVPAQEPSPAGGVEERTVQVEGEAVRAWCTPGPVEVLLLHDPSDGPLGWLPVLRRLAGRVGACAYERPGMAAAGDAGADGISPARGWFELADGLAGVHRTLAGPRPVLAGEGVGGLYAHLLALDRPAEVGGLVLVEPVVPGLLADMRRGMPDSVAQRRVAARHRPNADGVRVEALLARVGRRRLPAELPLTVLTATERATGPGWTPRWVAEAARRHHGRLITGQRLGRHLPAPAGSGDVPGEAPDLLAEEILRVVALRRR